MNVPRALVDLISGIRRDKQEIPWRYCRLANISLLGPSRFSWARILCEEDEGGQMFTARCPALLFPELEPYAAELLAWRENPGAQDQPIIPIMFPEGGQPYFHSQLDPLSSHGCLTDMPPQLLIHIQNARAGLGTPIF